MEAQASRQPRVTLSDAHQAFIRDQVEPLRRLTPSDPQWQKLHQAFLAKFPTLQRKPTLRQYKYEAAMSAVRHHEETLRRVATVGSDAGLRHGPQSHEDRTEEDVVAPPIVDDAFCSDSSVEEEEQKDGEETEEDEEEEEEEEMEDVEEAAEEPDAERESDVDGEEHAATEAQKLRECMLAVKKQLAGKQRAAQEWKALFEATRVAGQDLKRELFETKAALRAKDEQLSEQSEQETEQKNALRDKDAQILELQKLLMQAQQHVNEAQNSTRLIMRPAAAAPS